MDRGALVMGSLGEDAQCVRTADGDGYGYGDGDGYCDGYCDGDGY